MLSGKGVRKDEKKVIVCKTLDQLSDEEAAETGSIKKNCLECGTGIWVVPRNLIISDELMCLKCAVALAQKVTKSEGQVKIHMAKPFADMLHKIESN